MVSTRHPWCLSRWSQQNRVAEPLSSKLEVYDARDMASSLPPTRQSSKKSTEEPYMQDVHPHRYVVGFQRQMQRLDRLYPDLVVSDAAQPIELTQISAEQAGASERDVVLYDKRLRHLDGLIMNWQDDGAAVDYAPTDSLDESNESVVRFAAVGPSTTYLQFADVPAYSLSTLPKSGIDGCYIREIVQDGHPFVEMTFVCREPGWLTIDSCRFVDAMAIGARVAVGLVPVDEELNASAAALLFEGDPCLTSDPALPRAIWSASEFAPCSKNTLATALPSL